MSRRVKRTILENYEVLFNVKKNQCQMMKDRGYQLTNALTGRDESWLLNLQSSDPQALQLFNQTYMLENLSFKQAMTALYYHTTEPTVTYVFYPETQEGAFTGIDEIREAIKTVKDNGYPNFLIVSHAPLSPASANIVRDSLPLVRFQHFLYQDLSYNLTRHAFNSKYRKLSKDEVEALTQRGINFATMTKNTINDSSIKYYDGRDGDVFEVTRTVFQYPTINPIQVVYQVITESRY